MISSKVKSLVIVFALFLIAGVITVGCKQKTENNWVNTNSLPGHAFNKSAAKHSSTIVYLGDDDAPNVNFGPKDISFKFKDLK